MKRSCWVGYFVARLYSSVSHNLYLSATPPPSLWTARTEWSCMRPTHAASQPESPFRRQCFQLLRNKMMHSSSSFAPFHERDRLFHERERLLVEDQGFQSFDQWRRATSRTPETVLLRLSSSTTALQSAKLSQPRLRATPAGTWRASPWGERAKTSWGEPPPTGSTPPSLPPLRLLNAGHTARINAERHRQRQLFQSTQDRDASMGVGVVYGTKVNWDARPVKTLIGICM